MYTGRVTQVARFVVVPRGGVLTILPARTKERDALPCGGVLRPSQDSVRASLLQRKVCGGSCLEASAPSLADTANGISTDGRCVASPRATVTPRSPGGRHEVEAVIRTIHYISILNAGLLIYEDSKPRGRYA